MKPIKFISHSPEETAEFARKFAGELKPGDFLCMYGDLGAGKTAFTQGLAVGLGVEDYVNSPTFTIVNEYEGRLPLYHFDVYRLADSEDLYDIGFEDYLYGEGVCVIEWAQKIEDALPSGGYRVIIRILEGEDAPREIRMEDRD